MDHVLSKPGYGFNKTCESALRHKVRAESPGRWIASGHSIRPGSDHWHVLIRARAIETGSYVLAPAQCGRHAGGRETYGHSLIVSPWGEILAEAGDEPGVILAEIDPDQSRRAREAIPALRKNQKNDRHWGARRAARQALQKLTGKKD